MPQEIVRDRVLLASGSVTIRASVRATVVHADVDAFDTVELNERIARQRAEAVQKMLVNKYGISKERIVAEGQGIGYMFEETDWKRVSICTINSK